MRADLFLVQYGFAASRTVAQKLIAEGAVTVDGKTVCKPAEDIFITEGCSAGGHTVSVAATPETRYVGRGGLKLEAALAAFPVSVEGATVADIGASTGGFTDCLLQKGAARVFAIDAGHGQLHPRLRADRRVRVAEGVNARYLTPAALVSMEETHRVNHPHLPILPFAGTVDGCVMDVSFISQTLLHPAIAPLLPPGGWFVSLIKPQFELCGGAIGKHGVVKRDKDRRFACDRVVASGASCGLTLVSLIPSPVEGGDGNIEFLAYFCKR